MFKLYEIPIFSALSAEHIEELQNAVHIKKYTQGNIAFYEGDESAFVHILMEGEVKMYKTTPKGTQMQIHRFTAPSLVAEFACFEKEPFPATCEFVSDGAMGLLHFDTFFKYLAQPQFSLELIKSLTAKVMTLSALVHKETILSSEAKVADLMLKKSAIFNRFKNNEIASMLNMTPETFSRILTKFKKEEVISFDEQQITIMNPDALHRIVETNMLKECTNCLTHFKEEMGIKD